MDLFKIPCNSSHSIILDYHKTVSLGSLSHIHIEEQEGGQYYHWEDNTSVAYELPLRSKNVITLVTFLSTLCKGSSKITSGTLD